ncbi:hypothetical protein Cch01nite_18180 [Cellulomonas chitinilytica]|uniref:Uncharacterized protein n=1 Tax=Cellulomonas chitinilytica TaxID=398759 RepID=A0A919P493_9CELL|nr:hypothetical protein Cch01nite_18180 [Cellulomonas chitinilytica]
MRIIAVATSAQFMHIDAQRPMLSPASASAHIVAAIDAAEHASTHCCIIVMSMPVVSGMVIDPIMSAIMLIAACHPSSRVQCPGPIDATPGARRVAMEETDS